jgi:hypothetical protein
MLCLGAIADSYPPQCGVVPIANWDWHEVDGEERASGTTWGTYHVIGTYDGDVFTVTDVGPVDTSDPHLDDDRIRTPCEKPEDGWPVPDPGREEDDDVIAANKAIRNDPEFAGLWIDYPLPATATATRSLTLLNVAFTDNLARHEAEIRVHWGGPLCVVQYERSLQELKRVQKELSDPGALGLDLQAFESGIDITRNIVEIGVVAIDDSARKALDDSTETARCEQSRLSVRSIECVPRRWTQHRLRWKCSRRVLRGVARA